MTRGVKVKGCTVEGCDGAHFGRGFCHCHYLRWRKYGSATTRGGHGRNWTEAEDARLLDLIARTPAGQRIAAGDAADLALILGRTPGAVYVRTTRLRHGRRAAKAAHSDPAGSVHPHGTARAGEAPTALHGQGPARV